MKKKNILDKTWKKCLLIFIIVFFITLLLAGGVVDYFDDIVEDNHIHPDVIIIKDKIDNGTYTVIDINNKTYNIGNNDSKVFDRIEINKKYKVVVEEPMQKSQNAYILQVHNETS